MAVFGETHPVIEIQPAGTPTVDLEHSIIKPKWAVTNLIKHQSVITGVRSFTKRSEDLAIFDVVINVWKYSIPANTMDTLLGYNHNTVFFKPHDESPNYIYEFGTSNEAEFYISLVRPFYYRNDPPELQDKLLMRFESLVPVDVTSVIDFPA